MLFVHKSSAPFPAEMYARKEAEKRALITKYLWKNLHTNYVESAENSFLFKLTAGNLEHGDKHYLQI